MNVRHGGSLRLEETDDWNAPLREQMWPPHAKHLVGLVVGVGGALRVQFWILASDKHRLTPHRSFPLSSNEPSLEVVRSFSTLARRLLMLTTKAWGRSAVIYPNGWWVLPAKGILSCVQDGGVKPHLLLGDANRNSKGQEDGSADTQVKARHTGLRN